MTRDEILAAYTVDSGGRITSPGKFEGEMIYAPYFWDALLNGFADSDENGVASFDVMDVDRAAFPELGDTTRVLLEESDNGFVYCTTRTPPAVHLL